MEPSNPGEGRRSIIILEIIIHARDAPSERKERPVVITEKSFSCDSNINAAERREREREHELNDENRGLFFSETVWIAIIIFCGSIVDCKSLTTDVGLRIIGLNTNEEDADGH